MFSLRSSKQSCSTLGIVVSAGIIALIFGILVPQTIPYQLVEFWKEGSQLDQVLDISKYWLISVVILNLLICVVKRKDIYFNNQHTMTLKTVFKKSIYAGITEEVGFRWLMFFNTVVGIQFINWILGGFLGGRGLTDIIYTGLFIPLADWATHGMLHNMLYNIHPGHSWFVVGAAIVSVSIRFRDGHLYLGLIGWVNAWFLGMFMFYLTFQYGLLAAILVHILYDIFALGVGYLDSVIWPKIYPDLARERDFGISISRLFAESLFRTR